VKYFRGLLNFLDHLTVKLTKTKGELYMNVLIEYLPFIIPLAILELALMLTALIHLLRHSKPKNLNLAAWVVIIVVINIIGPVLYFLIGRQDN
jgi:heme/copper-type cytochrome/quinol oxidase subunit 4